MQCCLNCSHIDDAAAAVLAGGCVRGPLLLFLHDNLITDTGASALAAGRLLRTVSTVHVYGNEGLTAAGRLALSRVCNCICR